jgi:outer membrane protein TolC
MKKALTVISVLGMVCGFVFSAESPEVKELSLKDAIYYALKNNLDLQVQKKNTEYASRTQQVNKSIFIPNFNMEFYNEETNAPSTDALSGADVRTRERISLNVGLSQRVPLGGTLSFNLYNLRYKDNSRFATVNPYLYSQGTLNLTQPLLKNFGTLATNYQIYLSVNNHKISQSQLKQTVIDLVYNIESAYWELVYAHQNLGATRMALERSKDLLKQNEIKVKVGTAAPIEILSSKAEVARNESALIAAEQTIQTREEALKRILNMSKEAFSLMPTDSPEIKPIPVDFNNFLMEALNNRMDIQQAKLNLENYNIGVKYFRNQLLPDLQLIAEYYTLGQGGEQIILAEGASLLDPNFDPATDIIGTVSRDIWASMRDTFKNLYKNYSVRLQLKMPIIWSKEKAELTQAKITLKRGLLELKNVENTVYSEVKEVIKELDGNRKLVEADKIALELAEETLKAEEKKLSVGLSTNFEVLQYQQQYAAAQTQLLRSTINYALTQAKIKRILNRTFKAYDIKFEEVLKN